MEQAHIGIIGGSGVYDVEELKVIKELFIKTPFGSPSDKILIGRFSKGENIAFLPRHGKGHRHLPTEVNSKANIWALKYLGVKYIISISAVGSLKEEIHPGDIVIPNQLIDRTKLRPQTFFGDGIVGHIQFADPFCNELCNMLIQEVKKLGYRLHEKGTYVCMEGPAFSTRAESHLYRSWDADIIGMTAIPEAMLAREAEICYANISLPTDYDSWRESEEAVSVEMVVQCMRENIKKAKQIIKEVTLKIPQNMSCGCHKAAEFAVMTNKKYFPKKTMKKLELFYGKYFNT